MGTDSELGSSGNKGKKRRNCCCACLCSPCGIIVLIATLIGLALMLFYFWPRNPDVSVSIPQDRPFVQGLDVKTNASNPALGLLSASEANPFSLVLNLSALVSVNSDNYIDIYAKRIDVTIKLLDDSGKELPSVSGVSELIGVMFPKKSNTSVNAVRFLLPHSFGVVYSLKGN
jgi:hypothetical protein